MWKWLTLGGVSIASVYFLKRYYFAGGVCYCKERLDGKIVIITGANSGIGKATAIILAEKGATLILGCRNKVQSQKAVEEIISLTNNRSVRFEHLDLASFKSIESFVYGLKNSGVSNIYALINNAGIFYNPFKLTEDGFEITFQTNYLGPFYLTHLLIDCNILAKKARIINVSSEGHRIPKELDLSKVAIPRPDIGHFLRYGESKLCLTLFTQKLAAQFKEIASFNVNPGNVETNVLKYFPIYANPLLYYLLLPIRLIAVKNCKEGAQTTVHCTINSTCSIFSGGYFSDCKINKPSNLALDEVLADNLYMESLNWSRFKNSIEK